MNTTMTETPTATVITSAELLEHWQGHRRLTRKVIEAFPEKDFFNYSIGAMRPFAEMIKELLSIAVPGVRQIADADGENEYLTQATSKVEILTLWDKATEELNHYWRQIEDEKFHENILLFGKYPGTVFSSVLYMIDNEIHHRGQGYVYLRSLGIEPHPFWDR